MWFSVVCCLSDLPAFAMNHGGPRCLLRKTRLFTRPDHADFQDLDHGIKPNHSLSSYHQKIGCCKENIYRKTAWVLPGRLSLLFHGRCPHRVGLRAESVLVAEEFQSIFPDPALPRCSWLPMYDLAVTLPCLRRCKLWLQQEQAALTRMTAPAAALDLPFHSGAWPWKVWGESVWS